MTDEWKCKGCGESVPFSQEKCQCGGTVAVKVRE